MRDQRINELYALILDQLDIGLHVVDTSGRTLIYNRKMAEFEEIPPEEIKGKDILDALNSAPEASSFLTSLKYGSILENKKQCYITNKGSHVTTVNTTIPLYADGQLIGAMELAKDIRLIKQLADQVSDLQEQLQHKNLACAYSQPTVKYDFTDILGQAPPLLAAIHKARLASRTDSNILIYGETGTGKELFAQSIHKASPRGCGSFIAQNCAALPEELLEGLLFGTSKGGFTGALDRPGLVELAHGGSLFLDELNSMPLGLQAKLLRVIQNRSVRRVGGLRELSVDVRIISSCSMDPEQAMAQHLLREDLFYRLNVVTLAIPPLRQRCEDIPLLVKSFTDKFSRQFAIPVPEVLPETLDLFLNYKWPGNVRELENVIEGSLNLIPNHAPLAPCHLPEYLKRRLNTGTPSGPGLRLVTADMEKERIKAALFECKGNISQTAAKLGISRQSLQYKLKKYQLR